MLYKTGISIFLFLYTSLVWSACGPLCTCSILAGGAISFSSFSPISSGNTDTTGSFTLSCTAISINLTADYSIALSEGNSGSFATRTMLKTAIPLNYNLYTSAARSIIWGDGTGGTGVVTGSLPIIIIGTVTRVIDVYGRITGPQTSVTPGGTYTDSITITVTY